MRSVSAIGVALALSLSSFAVSQETRPTTHRAPRGIASRVTLPFEAGLLRAKAASDLSSPVLLRIVSPPDSMPQEAEVVGVIAGTYDISEFLERIDATPGVELPRMPIEIYSVIDSVGTQEVATGPFGRLKLWRGYGVLVAVAFAAWLLLPLVIVIRSRRPRQPEPPPPVPAAPVTTLDEIRSILALGPAASLPTDQRGRLELLLVRWMDERRDALGVALHERKQPPHVRIAALRRSPRFRDVMIAVERWLHAGIEPAEAEHIGDKLLDMIREIDAPESISSSVQGAIAKGGAQ